MKLKGIFLIGLICMGCFSACRGQAESREKSLSIFAAASLTEAFTEIGEQFEGLNPGVEVNFNFAGSQQLAQQIIEGAPADLFSSASPQYMETLIEAGLVETEAEQIFARNRLVVIYPKENPAQITQLADLAQPRMSLVLAAPEVPVGKYSREFLDNAEQDPAFGSGFRDAVLANVVSYEENVKAVLAKVALGEADAGIVYRSDLTGENARQVGLIDIPEDLNVIALYPIAPLRNSSHPELSVTFIDFVLSSVGQDILAQYGFLGAEPQR